MFSYRRVDSSDPRRADLTRPFVLPPEWTSQDLDVFAAFLGSASMMSGAAMMTRAPQIAYLGMIFACAHLAHEKPIKSTKTAEAGTGGPWMSLTFSLLALLALVIPKLAVAVPKA